MDEKNRPAGVDAPPRVVMSGPPWGNYVDPDLAYIRGQLGSVGSGAIGGRSFANLGGFVEANGEETKQLIAEAHRILEERAEHPAAEPPTDTDKS
jgi:hypothetical protein